MFRGMGRGFYGPGPGFWRGWGGRRFRAGLFWGGGYPAARPGVGFGWGRGWGCGWGRPIWGGGAYWPADPNLYWFPPWGPYGREPTDEAEYLKAETEALELEAKMLRAELEAIKKRIVEIEETGQEE